MSNLPLYNNTGKEIESVKLDDGVFDGKVNRASIYQTVNAYLANQRTGLAATKTRGEVSGGGRKPWRQKGTGRARVGSTRSPLWRHGGVVFGPHPRDFSYSIPQKIKILALKSSLNAKLNENNLMILESFGLPEPKTKEVAKIFHNLKIDFPGKKKSDSVLLLLEKIDKNLILASRNIDSLTINLATDTNAYEILSHKKLIIIKDALKDLISRINTNKSNKHSLSREKQG